jgi:hypothetical protein
MRKESSHVLGVCQDNQKMRVRRYAFTITRISLAPPEVLARLNTRFSAVLLGDRFAMVRLRLNDESIQTPYRRPELASLQPAFGQIRANPVVIQLSEYSSPNYSVRKRQKIHFHVFWLGRIYRTSPREGF